MRGKNKTNRFKMRTGPSGGHPVAASYLSVPRLTGMAPEIVADNHLNETCRILAAIDRFRSVKPYLHGRNHLEVLAAVLGDWTDELVPSEIRAEFPFEIDVILQSDSSMEIDMAEGGIALLFHLNEFNNRDMYVRETLEEYERRQPGLGKLLMALLTGSPISLGTPADIYDMASWTFWGGEDDEHSRLEELRADFMTETEDEDEINGSLEIYIPIRYEHFLNHFPEWMFRRDFDIFDKKWRVPDELHPLYQAVMSYKQLDGRHHRGYPRNNLPVIMATLDDDRFDFGLDIMDQAGQDAMECGDMIYFSPCIWELNPNKPRQLRDGLADFERSLIVFREAIRFLLMKNPPKAEEKAA